MSKHTFVYIRSDVRYDVYECTKCGKVVKTTNLSDYEKDKCAGGVTRVG